MKKSNSFAYVYVYTHADNLIINRNEIKCTPLRLGTMRQQRHSCVLIQRSPTDLTMLHVAAIVALCIVATCKTILFIVLLGVFFSKNFRKYSFISLLIFDCGFVLQLQLALCCCFHTNLLLLLLQLLPLHLLILLLLFVKKYICSMLHEHKRKHAQTLVQTLLQHTLKHLLYLRYFRNCFACILNALTYTF